MKFTTEKGENFEETILIFSKDELLYFCERRLGFHENRNNNKITKTSGLGY